MRALLAPGSQSNISFRRDRLFAFGGSKRDDGAATRVCCVHSSSRRSAVHHFGAAVRCPSLFRDAVADDRALPRGPHGGRQRSSRTAERLLHGARTTAASGRRTDYGRVWTPIFDDQPTGSIGALAVAPSDPNVIYVGSGEGLQRPDLSVGDGIYKSTDAGKTWHAPGPRRRPADRRRSSSIRATRTRLFVAVLGHPYGPNAERGVFRSIDGGETWQKVLYKDEDTGAVDLAFDPGRSAERSMPCSGRRGRGPGRYGNAYEAAGQRALQVHRRRHDLAAPDEGAAGGRGRPRAASASPSLRATASGSTRSSRRAGRRAASTAPTTRARAGSASTPRTASAGAAPTSPRSRSTRRTRTSSTSANTSTYRSTDGGRSFTAIKGAPGGDDYHRIWINPENPRDHAPREPTRARSITVNGGETWSSWYNQPTAQFYHVSTDNRFPYRVYGGQQESGSAGVASRGNDGADHVPRVASRSASRSTATSRPIPLHPDIVYGGKLTRFDEATGQMQNVGPGPAARRQVPLRPHGAGALLARRSRTSCSSRRNVLWKTTNGGETLGDDQPGPDARRPGNAAEPRTASRTRTPSGKHRGVIYTIAPSPQDATTIWAGTDDGLIHVTARRREDLEERHAAGADALEQGVADGRLALRRGRRPTRPSNAFRLDDLRPHIYRTHDGGKTWHEIVDGIPGRTPPSTWCARTRSARASSSREPSARSTSPSTTATTGSRCG